MKKLKGNYGLYLSLGILGLAVAGSAFFYKKESDKAKQLKADVSKMRDQISSIRFTIPTEEHRQHLQEQYAQVEEKYKEIVAQALEWNHLPQPMTGLQFAGYMGSTIDAIRDAARRRGILIDDKKARYLGFEEYAVAPPTSDEDVFLLQREFSAAVDIARLLIASNVYSIDRMARGREARMEEGTVSTALERMLADEEYSSARRRSRQDFYDTVPFRVQFTCTYPSLAFFMKSLITPQRLGADQLPRNFLVINDMRFKVQEQESEEKERVRRLSRETVTPVVYTATGRRTTGVRPEDIPEDLPGAEALIDRYGEAKALMIFKLWRTWSQERKEIFRLERRLGETISDDERERATARLERMRRELADRQKLKGRPPEYNTLEVTLLLDFVQFTDTLVAELEKDKSETGPSASSPSMARR